MMVPLAATVFSVLAAYPSGVVQGSTAYPLGVVDRPGIVPSPGALVTLAAAHTGGRSQGSVGLVLGIPGDWELTGELAEDEGTVSEAALGLGGLLHLAGPFEIDLRFLLPIYQEGEPLRDFSLGPACSYTWGSTGVVSGFAHLLHVGFSGDPTLALPIEIAVGFQPFERLYLCASAIFGEIGVVGTPSYWIADRSPVDAGLIVVLSEMWDAGVILSTSDLVRWQAEWSYGFFLSLKAVR